jgi:membrane-bound serine protease (ClpP class)
MSRLRRSLGFQAAMMLLVGLAGIAAAQPARDATSSSPSPGGTALVVEIKDAIGPATREFFVRALERAEEQDAALLILVLDTPGGLSESMRDMIRAILSAKLPVVTYVSPPGAHAASAGTFILYASHVAAMAPATNLGAATPVPIGGSPRGRDTGPNDAKEKGGSADDGQAPAAMDRKAMNDAVAYIRSIAEMRGRDPTFAEESVTQAASITANEALQRGVIDLIAADLPELLASLDGREVTLPTGKIALATRGITVEQVEMDWRTSLLAVLTNPLVAYGLLIVGIYGLMFEGYNPGALVPGVVGGVCLLLGLYALQVLSVNFAGLALIVLGIAMMAAEFFVPSFGVLGFGGIAAFVIGSIVLMDTDAPGVMASRGLIGGIATAAGAAMLATIAMAMRSRRRPVVTGREQLVGGIAEALADFSGEGTVRIFGETWNAVSAGPVAAGQRLRIDRVEGLTLYVSPAE